MCVCVVGWFPGNMVTQEDPETLPFMDTPNLKLYVEQFPFFRNFISEKNP